MKKKVALLGATGSIGKSTVDILRNAKDRFEPVLFSAYRNAEELLKLKREFPGALTALVDDSAADRSPAKGGYSISREIDFTGKDGLLEAIAASGADIAVNGIAGAAGLEPSAAVIESGADLALANKETIVMAGHIIRALAEKNKVNIIPVDSEHSAIFKLLGAHGSSRAAEIILTASGGPFRNTPFDRLLRVTPEEALAHPTWKMGPKITVDSATLANKGLELIEAAGFFAFSPEKIKVVIHPQSIVHSMIRLRNGAVYAQMSKPDMRLPIHDALSWPETEESPYGALDFDSLSLSFEKWDPSRFPMLTLAYEALKGGPLLPVAYNAANEIAVEAFFARKIGFLDIPRVVEYVLSVAGSGGCGGIETVLAQDRESRIRAEEFLRMGVNHAYL